MTQFILSRGSLYCALEHLFACEYLNAPSRGLSNAICGLSSDSCHCRLLTTLSSHRLTLLHFLLVGGVRLAYIIAPLLPHVGLVSPSSLRLPCSLSPQPMLSMSFCV